MPFPFSDLSASKQRPAVVVGVMPQGDLILCQITSKMPRDAHEVLIQSKDFSVGELAHTSTIRPGKLFTLHQRLISRRAGIISAEKMVQVRTALRHLLQL